MKRFLVLYINKEGDHALPLTIDEVDELMSIKVDENEVTKSFREKINKLKSLNCCYYKKEDIKNRLILHIEE